MSPIKQILVCCDDSVSQTDTCFQYYTFSLYESKNTSKKTNSKNSLSLPRLGSGFLMAYLAWNVFFTQHFCCAKADPYLSQQVPIAHIASSSDEEAVFNKNQKLLDSNFIQISKPPKQIKKIKSKTNQKSTERKLQEKYHFLVGVGGSLESHNSFSPNSSNVEKSQWLKTVLLDLKNLQLNQEELSNTVNFMDITSDKFLQHLDRILAIPLKKREMGELWFTNPQKMMTLDPNKYSGLNFTGKDGEQVALKEENFKRLFNDTNFSNHYQFYKYLVKTNHKNFEHVQNLKNGLQNLFKIQNDFAVVKDSISENTQIYQTPGKLTTASTRSPVHFQFYSRALPFINLNVGASYGLLEQTGYIGLGKVHFHRFTDSKVGMMLGLDAGIQYDFAKNAFGSQYLKVFAGVGVSV